MKFAVVYESSREAYAIEDIRRPMTVGQLRSALKDYDDDDFFIISHDGGYTYGSIQGESFWKQSSDEDAFEQEW